MSLPVRECGLKSDNLRRIGRKFESLPVRECGLKYKVEIKPFQNPFVTPCAGVWIEIIEQSRAVMEEFVTPCAGVWIEIPESNFQYMLFYLSLPVRECGLK